MIEWLKRLLREADRFEMPPRVRRLPTCRFRPLDPTEFEACAELYRLNEPARFPAGHFDHFLEWLRSGRSLVLVCEAAGEIRGFGGISMHRRPASESAALAFGMVHPAHHRMGYGTVTTTSDAPKPTRTSTA